MSSTLPVWRKNLYICCAATFIVSIGMSQMAPILPLYIAELGIEAPADIARWAGIIFGCNFISLAIFSPIWGRLSDRVGRKPMILRASGWLGLIMIGMGFAQSVWHLVILRLLQGCLSGFQAAVIPLLAQETPKEHSGWAMGMFFTSQVSGGLMGPIFGGWLSEIIGFRNSFLLIGCCCLLGFIALTQVRETKHPAPSKTATEPQPSFWQLDQHNAIIGVFVTTILLHFSLSCVSPILTVYVQEIAGNIDHIALISGAVFSASGFASMLFASRLGNLADVERILAVNNPDSNDPIDVLAKVGGFELGAIAGLMPSTNNLIRQLSPAPLMGRIFGINQSAQFIGMFTGAFFGGQLVALLGIRNLFLIVASLLILNACWCRLRIFRTTP